MLWNRSSVRSLTKPAQWGLQPSLTSPEWAHFWQDLDYALWFPGRVEPNALGSVGGAVTVSGDAKMTVSNAGPAVVFDGTGDYLDSGYGNGRSWSRITIHAYYRTADTNFATDIAALFGLESAAGTTQIFAYFGFDASNNNVHWRFRSTAGIALVTATDAAFADGRPHLLSCVYDGSSVLVYLDGRLIASATGAGIVPTGPVNFFVGANNNNGTASDEWRGDLYYLAMYSYAWPEGAIRNLAATPWGPWRSVPRRFVPVLPPSSSTAAVSAAPVVIHAPAVITVAGGLTRVIGAASVVAHAPAVATTANVTRAVSAAPLIMHAPAVATSVGAVTRSVSAGPVIVHAPAVTASVSVVGAVAIGSAGVVVHAPAVVTTPGSISRTLSAAPVIAHAPAVRTVPGALTRVVGAASMVLHAPAVSTSVGAATRLISAAPLVVHAPQVATTTGAVARTIGSAVTVIHAPAVTASITFSQTKAITSATMILHAPALANAYSLLYPVPPLGASADDLRQAVSVDDMRTAVSVDNLSASVSLY